MSVQVAAVAGVDVVCDGLDRWYRETERILGFRAPWTVETAEMIIFELRLVVGPHAVMNRMRFGAPPPALELAR